MTTRWIDNTTDRWLIWWHVESMTHLMILAADNWSIMCLELWHNQPMTHRKDTVDRLLIWWLDWSMYHQSVTQLMTPFDAPPIGDSPDVSHDDTNGLMAHLMTPSIFDSYDDNQSIIYLRTPRIDGSSDGSNNRWLIRWHHQSTNWSSEDTVSRWPMWWQPNDDSSDDTTDRLLVWWHHQSTTR